VGLEPRDQLGRSDGFGEVVVGACVQAAHDARLILPAAGEQDRHQAVLFPDPAAHLDTWRTRLKREAEALNSI